MRTAQLTDVGRKRVHNEDNLGVSEFSLAHQGRGGRFLVGLVCDGMGGAAGGEVASALAIEAIFREVYGEILSVALDPAHEFLEPRGVLRDAIQRANRAVFQEARSRPGHSGMGCTATASLTCFGRIYLGQVGDSRGYRLRQGEIEQLTHDHSFVHELLRDGRLTPEEAENHPRKSVITRAIGSRPEVTPDLFEFPLEEGDIFLLCSDGLTGMVPDPELHELLSALPADPSEDDLAGCCRELIDRANAAGGTDNISVVLLRAGSEDIPEILSDPIPMGALEVDRVLTWTEAAEGGYPDVSFHDVEVRRRRV